MTFDRGLLAAALAWALFGCAARADVAELEARIEATAPVCAGATDCAAKWGAARDWVTADAGFMIRVDTADHIETYSGNPWQDPRLIVSVDRVPLGGDRFRIVVAISCRYDYGCIPDRWNAALAFNRAVAAAHQ